MWQKPIFGAVVCCFFFFCVLLSFLSFQMKIFQICGTSGYLCVNPIQSIPVCSGVWDSLTLSLILCVFFFFDSQTNWLANCLVCFNSIQRRVFWGTRDGLFFTWGFLSSYYYSSTAVRVCVCVCDFSSEILFEEIFSKCFLVFLLRTSSDCEWFNHTTTTTKTTIQKKKRLNETRFDWKEIENDINKS